MAKFIKQTRYALIMNQEELNTLYRIMIDSAEIVDEIVVRMAETIVDDVDNLDCDDESLQPIEPDEYEDEDVDEEMPF